MKIKIMCPKCKKNTLHVWPLEISSDEVWCDVCGMTLSHPLFKEVFEKGRLKGIQDKRLEIQRVIGVQGY